MLTLYYKPTCPFCQRVLGEIEEMGLKINLKDIVADEASAAALIEKGGRRQVPFLLDEESNVAMYESNDIIAYLRERYPNGSAPTEHNGLQVHASGETCDSCQ